MITNNNNNHKTRGKTLDGPTLQDLVRNLLAMNVEPKDISKGKNNNCSNQGRNGNAPAKVYTETEDKSEKKRLEDIPIVQNFPEVITSFEYVKKIFRRRHLELDMVITSSKNKKEHEEHLKVILELLKKEELYAKFSKCEFWIPK
ncbi:hypothetical protein Tco_0863342, partial [Tanacetum coccineum]